jgi:hypothetical protein
MKRGPSDDELTPPLRGDNMLSVVQMIADVDLRMPLQFEDQAAALHLGHFAKRSVLGQYITCMLDGTETDAEPGISSLEMSNNVRNAAEVASIPGAAAPGFPRRPRRVIATPIAKYLAPPTCTNPKYQLPALVP